MKKIILLFLFLCLFSVKVIAQENISNDSLNPSDNPFTVTDPGNPLNDPKKVAETEKGINRFYKMIGLNVNFKWEVPNFFCESCMERFAADAARKILVVRSWFNARGRGLINFWLKIWSVIFRVKYIPLDINFPDIDSYPPGYITPTPTIYNQCKDSDGDDRFKQGLVTSGKNNLCRGSACFDGCSRQWGRTRGFVSYATEWICVDDQPEEVLLECPGSCLGGHCTEP